MGIGRFLMLRFFAFIFLGFVPLPAVSAELSVYEITPIPIILLEGTINRGDSSKFISFTHGMDKAIVLLHSDGGSLYDGLMIGRHIRLKKFTTWVSSKTGPCISICGFAWLAGSPMAMDSSAKIGFHAAYIVKNGKPQVSAAGNAFIGAYLSILGFNERVIYYTTNIMPSSMQWLSLVDARTLGLNVSIIGK